jgi:hypothetical protein
MARVTPARRIYLGSTERFRSYKGANLTFPKKYSKYAAMTLAQPTLQAYYRLNDADQISGVLDSGPYDLHIPGFGNAVATVPGGLPYDDDRAAGPSGTGGNSNLGTGPYHASMNNDGSSPGISFEYWQWSSGLPPSTNVLAARGTGTVQRQWALYQAVPGYIGVRLFGSQGGVNTALTTASYTGLGDSKWHYVVVTYNSTIGAQVWIDAWAYPPTTYKGPLITTQTTPGLGINLTVSPTLALDEFAVYNTTLTPAYIAAHWASAWDGNYPS